MRHEHHSRCVVDPAGVCRYSRENLHFEYCAHFQPLPPNVEVTYEPYHHDQDYGFHGQQVGVQRYGHAFSAEYGNEPFGSSLSHVHSAESECFRGYEEYPAHATRTSGSQFRHSNGEFEDRYGGNIDSSRELSFNVDHADESHNSYSRHQCSRLNNNDGFTDEYDDDSSGSEMYLSGDPFWEDEFPELDGDRGFVSSDFGKRPRAFSAMNRGSDIPAPGRLRNRGFSLDSHQSRARGPPHRRRREILASIFSARGPAIGPTHGGRGGHASTRCTRRGGQTPAVIACPAGEHGTSTNGAAELDSVLLPAELNSTLLSAELGSTRLPELTANKTTKFSNASALRPGRRTHLQNIVSEYRAELEATPNMAGRFSRRRTHRKNVVSEFRAELEATPKPNKTFEEWHSLP